MPNTCVLRNCGECLVLQELGVNVMLGVMLCLLGLECCKALMTGVMVLFLEEWHSLGYDCRCWLEQPERKHCR
jgi:hypothetical protein